jgi:Calcineurin-like phosphoesterase
VRISVLLLVLAAPATALAQSRLPGTVEGTVFDDANRDGERAPSETGLPGIVVCDRSSCAVTDVEGTYRLPVGQGQDVVWVRQPEGFRAARGFFRPVPAEPSSARVSFPLERREEPSDFTFVHASDTHLDEESLPRFRRLRELVVERGAAFVLVTGDLVRDALRVDEATARERFERFRREKDAFPVPMWVVPGNHENFGIERHLSGVSKDNPLYGKAMYHLYLGPSYYSFDFGGIHFVGLDTVDIDDRWYYGHVDATQLHWLADDLSHVAPETPIVTFNHIPFFSALLGAGGYLPDDGDTPGSVIVVGGKAQYRHVVSNFADVLKLFEGRRYPLALAGHIHAREELVIGDERFSTRFNQTAAVVGGAGEDYGMKLVSGVTLYRVRGGVIDGGEFIPLDPPAGTH